MKEHNTPHYVLPDDFIIKLQKLSDNYEDRAGLYKFDLYLMFINKLPYQFTHFPKDKPVLIKYIDMQSQTISFKIWGKNKQGSSVLTELPNAQDLFDPLFKSNHVTTVNNSQLIPVESKKIQKEIFDMIRSHQGHAIQYKQSNSLSCFFGSKDLDMRFRQIRFIECMLEYYAPSLSEETAFESDERYAQYIQALRIIATLVLYQKYKIDGAYWLRSSKGSKLCQLLDDALQLDPEKNALDKLTSVYLFEEAYEAINTHALQYKNNEILNQKIPYEEWAQYKSFVFKEHQRLEEKSKTNFPITRVLVPVFSVPFEWTGIAIGVVLAGGLEQSTKLLSTKSSLISIVSGSMVKILGGGGVPGAILLAKPIVDNFTRGFCMASITWICGKSCKLAGSFVGLTAGLGLDAGYHFLRFFSNQLSHLFKKSSEKTQMSGFSLIDGTRYIQGMPCQIEDNTESSFNKTRNPPHEESISDNIISGNLQEAIDEYTEESSKQTVQFKVTQDGLILQVGEEERKIPWEETDPSLRQFFEQKFFNDDLDETAPLLKKIDDPVSQQDEDRVLVSHGSFN